jgi:hypothetical protein|tara:strand:- start:911 stop:1192 length:282 start_codon:yes stop_codon:yes gene_type:complete
MTNVITIEKNIPMPTIGSRSSTNKYVFVHQLEVTDSCVINGNTPDMTPKAVRCWVYNQRRKAKTPELRARRYVIRTLSGSSTNPTSIRLWRRV